MMSSPPRWPRGYTGRLFRVERQAGAGAPSVTVSSCPAVSRPNSTGMKAPIAYSLTTGCGVLEALVRAAQRGVDVRLIADRTTPRERAGGVDALVRPGASVLIDRGRPSEDHGYRRPGDAVQLDELERRCGAQLRKPQPRCFPAFAEAYAGHWRRRLAASAPFVSRKEWYRQRTAGNPL